MGRIITAARNRGIGQLHMICMRGNEPMQRLAEKFGARLSVEPGEVTGRIEPASPTPLSLLGETLHDTTDFVTAVMHWRSGP